MIGVQGERGYPPPARISQAIEIQLLPDLVKTESSFYIRRRHDLVADGLSELLFSQTEGVDHSIIYRFQLRRVIQVILI